MGSLGKVVFILFIAFMLYFIWSVKDVKGGEINMEFYAVICPKVNAVPCVVRTKRIPRETTPFQCFHNGMPQLVKWMAPYPNWTVKKWGCRPEGLSA